MTMMRKPLMIIIYGLATFIPLCGQTLISDFEKNSSSFDVGKMIPIGDMEMKIVDNPSRTGINTSKKVLRMVRRTEGKEQWADRKSTRLNSSHSDRSRMPSSA